MCDDTTRHNMMQGPQHWPRQVKLELLPGHAACCRVEHSLTIISIDRYCKCKIELII